MHIFRNRFGNANEIGIRHSAIDSTFAIPFDIRQSHSTFGNHIRHSALTFGIPPISFGIRQSKTRHSAIGNRQSSAKEQ
jgi:hypothetical protein